MQLLPEEVDGNIDGMFTSLCSLLPTETQKSLQTVFALKLKKTITSQWHNTSLMIHVFWL